MTLELVLGKINTASKKSRLQWMVVYLVI